MESASQQFLLRTTRLGSASHALSLIHIFVWLAIPIAAYGKSPFFDRKPKK